MHLSHSEVNCGCNAVISGSLTFMDRLLQLDMETLYLTQRLVSLFQC